MTLPKTPSPIVPKSVTPAPAAQSSSTPDIEIIICNLHLNGEICLERLQMVLESVTDAVVQTQDISAQIQALANKNVQELTFTSIVVDALLLVATDGVENVISEVLSGPIQGVLRSLFLHNNALASLTTAAAGSVISGATGLAVSVSWESISGQFGPFSRGVRRAAEEGFKNIGKALADAVKAESNPKAGTGPSNDLPRTVIIRNAQNYISAHRLALRAALIELTYLIRTGQISPSSAASLLDTLALDSLGGSLEKLRGKFAVAFEMLIWERIYATAMKQAGWAVQGTSTKQPSAVEKLPSGGTAFMLGIPGALVDYWRARFRAQISLTGANKGAIGDISALYNLFRDVENAVADKISSLGGGAANLVGSTLVTP